MAGARHGMCELTARHGHGMLCVNRPLQSMADAWRRRRPVGRGWTSGFTTRLHRQSNADRTPPELQRQCTVDVSGTRCQGKTITWRHSQPWWGRGHKNTHEYIGVQTGYKFTLHMPLADLQGPSWPSLPFRDYLITLGFTILAITTGFDNLNKNLTEILLALELANLARYITVSPTS